MVFKRSRNADRFACASGVSRSVACNVFFKGDPEAFQRPVNAGLTDADLVLGMHESGEFIQGCVVVLSDESSKGLEPVSIEFRAWPVLTRVRRDIARVGVMLDQFAYEIAADPEALGELAVTTFLVGVRVDYFLTEIVGVRGRHTRV